MTTKQRATIEDLYKVPNKAEIVDGEVLPMPPTGDWPNRAGGNIYIHLRQYESSTKIGLAYTDNIGYVVNLPDRKSFSPDVSFYIGKSAEMRFLQGAPIFAVEIRSENDYGDKAEEKIKKKIADYFAAGTKVVWDVDLLGEAVIKVYRVDDRDNPTIYRRNEIAEAEPALPGWQFSVNNLFQ